MGDVIRDLIVERKQKFVAIARAMPTTPQNFQHILRRRKIGDDILRSISRAMGVDVVELIRLKQDQLAGVAGSTRHSTPGLPKWGIRHGTELVIRLEEYPDEVQLKIIRFLQQLPKKEER